MVNLLEIYEEAYHVGKSEEERKSLLLLMQAAFEKEQNNASLDEVLTDMEQKLKYMIHRDS